MRYIAVADLPLLVLRCMCLVGDPVRDLIGEAARAMEASSSVASKLTPTSSSGKTSASDKTKAAIPRNASWKSNRMNKNNERTIAVSLCTCIITSKTINNQ